LLYSEHLKVVFEFFFGRNILCFP